MDETARTADGRHWRPSATIEMLRRRAALLATLRAFFHRNGYWEVETPLLCRESVVDAHLDPFELYTEEHERLFLQTSPELCMKRLVSAGAERIFQVTRAFRRGESGALHNPEFTMVEWYAVGTTHHEQMDFVESLVRELHAAATDDGEHRNAADGSEAAIAAEARAGLSSSPFRRLTYSEAFRNSLGVEDVLRCDAGRLARLAASAGVRAPDSVSATDVDRDTWLNLLLAERVQPNLGRNVPEFMYDFPASQAALARVRAGDPPVAERFELYWRGVELCNGYQELTDADELRERIQQQNALRRREGKRTLPAPTTLLAAMDFGLPECSGVALGFDRLAMLLLGARRLDAVTAFPFERC